MNLRQRRITSAIALFLVFATTQVIVGVSFAAPQPLTVRNEVAVTLPAPQATGSLTTQGNKPITVNGAAAISGATVVSGASIETPAGVGATINLAALGSLQIDSNSKLSLEFANGSVKVVLLQGCVTLHTKKGTSGEVDTSQGVGGKSDPAKDSVVKVCAPGSAPPPAPAPADAGGLLGIGTGATISLAALAATMAIVPFIERGRNPSP